MRNSNSGIITRSILWVALAGMIFAIHFWIQKARDFDQGCLGLLKPPAVVTSQGCVEAGTLPASHLLGVSNVAWGYAFYFGVALVSFAKIVTSASWARRLHRMSEAATVVAFIYSAYLVTVMARTAERLCVLCVISAVLVTILLALHVALRRSGGFQPVAETERNRELGLACGALFGTMGLLVGVLLFVNRLGTRPLDQGSTGEEFEQLVGQSLPLFIDGERLAEMRACRFDVRAPRLDPNEFIGPDIPFVGKTDGISVIVFDDPNCPFCAAFHSQFLQIAERFKDRARFYIVPRALWDGSLLQIQALKVAEASGKYFELWQSMFDRQRPGATGMTLTEIESLFRDLGIDATDLERRLEATKADVLATSKRARDASVTGLPAIYIEGRRVQRPNYSVECLGKLISRMQAATPAQSP